MADHIPHASWFISAELRAEDGTVIARSIVPLEWSDAWLEKAHSNTVGVTFQGWLQTIRRQITKVARGR